MTAQVCDLICHRGEERLLLNEPLEQLFGAEFPRPAFVAPHSANWRGYVAAWEIQDGRLYLLEIKGQICTRSPDGSGPRSLYCRVGHEGSCTLRTVSLCDIMPASEGPVHASWVTARLRIPDGEMVEYVHLGHASRYERYILLDVEAGMLVGESSLTGEEWERLEAAEGRSDGRRSPKPKGRSAWWKFW